MPLPSSRFAAALLFLLCFAPIAQANNFSLQVIGWSADEQHFAIRTYDTHSDDSMGDEEPTYCPGYVDHEGNKFLGSLKLAVYDAKGKQLASFPIQDGDKCTPPKKAKERLANAKQEMAKLGIDLAQKKPGTELTPDDKGIISVKEGPGAPYTLEAEEQVTEHAAKDPKKEKARKARAKKSKQQQEEEEQEEEDPYAEIQVKGALVVFVRKGSERRQLFSEKVEGTYTPMMAGHYYTKLDRVWLSPGGRTVVFISHSSSGNMRDISESRDVLGAVSWGGEPLVLR